MAGYSVLGFVKFAEFIVMLIAAAEGLNLGLIAGDLKRHSSPLIIKKISKLSPVIINIKSKEPLSLPKLPPKPPPLKLAEQKKPGKKFPRSILPPILPPLLPGLPLLLPPLLPILPPLPPPPLLLLPPLLPPPLSILPISLLHPPPLLPLLSPLSLLPHLPSLPKCPLKPLRVPILKRSLLKVKPDLKVLDLPKIKIDKNIDTVDKLRDLKKKGSLSTADFLKLKHLLV